MLPRSVVEDMLELRVLYLDFNQVDPPWFVIGGLVVDWSTQWALVGVSSTHGDR
jgi:hypothetical protein